MDSLVDRVKAAAACIKQRRGGFEARLSPEVREQLLEIRRQHQAGELTCSAVWLADFICEMAASDGFAVCGRQGMRIWLARKD